MLDLHPPATPTRTGTATGLRTDHYELTMLDAALADGTAERPATFEAFARRLSPGTRYGVVGGTWRLAEALERFRFDDDHLGWLVGAGVVSAAAARYLAEWRFCGDIEVYPEGELWFPGSPLVTVTGTFADAVLLETIVLSILNHGCAIATAAAAITDAAAGRPVLEFGARRCHDEAAVDAARLAWIAGFAGTSNLEAGMRFGVPTTGTAAHAWTLVHEGEVDAFTAQLQALGVGTTLLVDTYDVGPGVEHAIEAARRVGAAGPAAIRIDSGDLAVEARRARRLLDAAGAIDTRITVTNDLDATAIATLVADGAPIDGFGVGTNLVATPPPGIVYKLVAVGDAAGNWEPVGKTSPGKHTVGGRKRAARTPAGEVVAVGELCPPGRALQAPLFIGGVRVAGTCPADAVAATRLARDRNEAARAELARLDHGGTPALETQLIEGGLR